MVGAAAMEFPKDPSWAQVEGSNEGGGGGERRVHSECRGPCEVSLNTVDLPDPVLVSSSRFRGRMLTPAFLLPEH